MRTGRRGKVVVAALSALALAGVAVAGPGTAGAKPRAGKSVIGGQVASQADWPWQAAITQRGRLHCGGSVIAPTKILTAAHCVFGFNPTRMTVVAGRSRLWGQGGEEIPVASAVIHPDYPRTRRHDVAVLTLALPTSSPSIGLPTVDQDLVETAPGSLLRVAGFGARDPLGGKLSATLLQTTERVRTGRRCRKTFFSDFSGRAMICALGSRVPAFKRVHTTACSGDSGGPLVSDASGRPLAVGVVSYGGRYCGFQAPTVYSRVSDALDFIRAATG